MILRLDEIFDAEKPIIGMVHLRPLPGSPRYDGDLERVIELALRDAITLASGGVDGVMVENFNDNPFKKRVTEPETIAAMSIIVHEIMKTVSIPVGINLLRNSAIEAAGIAYVTGGKFIRVNAFIENIETDSGLMEAIAPDLLRYIKKINAKLGILADIHVKHASVLGSRELDTIYLDAFERGLATAVIISGRRTGEPPDSSILKRLKAINKGPILIGSGLCLDNIKLLKYADGAIVGTFFKRNSRINEAVDEKRVKLFMSKVRELRQ